MTLYHPVQNYVINSGNASQSVGDSPRSSENNNTDTSSQYENVNERPSNHVDPNPNNGRDK